LKPVKLGLLGVGTVGASTALVLQNNAAEIARRAGRKIEIVQASRRDVGAGMPAGSGDIELVADPFEVVNNPDIDIVIELIGGYEPALQLVMQASTATKFLPRPSVRESMSCSKPPLPVAFRSSSRFAKA
jgi:homoserine dehydrogenase